MLLPGVFEVFMSLRREWAFVGPTAVKLHESQLMGKRAGNLKTVDVAVHTGDFPIFYYAAIKLMGFKPSRMMRGMYVFTRGGWTLKVHLLNRLPQVTLYDGIVPIASLRTLSQRNKSVQRMNKFTTRVRNATLNNVD